MKVMSHVSRMDTDLVLLLSDVQLEFTDRLSAALLAIALTPPRVEMICWYLCRLLSVLPSLVNA